MLMVYIDFLSRKVVKAERTMPDHSLYKCDFSEFDPCKMGEFFFGKEKSASAHRTESYDSVLIRVP